MATTPVCVAPKLIRCSSGRQFKNSGKGKLKSRKRKGNVSKEDIFQMLKGYVPIIERHMMGDSSGSE